MLTGCTAIVSKNPIGIKPVKIVADEWDGVWDGYGNGVGIADVVIIKVTNEDKGQMRIGVIHKTGDTFTLQNLDATIKFSNSSQIQQYTQEL